MLNILGMLVIPVFSIWDGIANIFSAMMLPLYWAVSGLLVLFFHFWSMFLGQGWSWTVAIVTLTMFIRTLLIPIFVRQIHSSRNMQLLQPKIQELQRKYGSDRERLGRETMKLYKEEGVNPGAACLPIILQLPIFWALFWTLNGVANNQPKGYFLQTAPELVESLKSATIFGAGLQKHVFPFTPFGVVQVVGITLVICMVVVLFVTQLQLMRKNMPAESLVGPMASTQKSMLYLFPIMYAFSSLVIPIGVLVYWLTTNLWTMIQQYILIHNNPTPNTPAYIVWEERMRAKGKDPDEIAQRRREKRRRTVKPVAGRQVGSAESTKTDGPVRQKIVRQTVARDTSVNSDGGRSKRVKKSRAQRKKN